MHYEINISKNGMHYFATDKRSLTDGRKTAIMLEHFVKVFPKSEGYEISVSYKPDIGYGLRNISEGDSYAELIQSLSERK